MNHPVIQNKISQNCLIKGKVLEKFLESLKNQKNYFQIQDYLGDGPQSLVLKAYNSKEKRKVALKIIECSNLRTQLNIEGLKKEYLILKEFCFSECIIKVFDYFYLQNDEDDQFIDQKIENKIAQSKKLKENIFFVLELEICEKNLKDLFKDIVKNGKYEDQKFKEMVAIRILDGLNSCHNQDITHRNLKPQNFLFNNENTIKLSDLGYISPIISTQSEEKFDGGNQYYSSPEIQKGFCFVESDLFALGLILLELDNLNELSGNWLQQKEIIEINNGQRILSDRKINRLTNIYQIIELCLKPSYKERKSAAQLLQILINKQKQEIPFLVYSTIFYCQFENQIKYIVESYNQKITDETKGQNRISKEEIVQIMKKLFEQTDYSQNFQFICFTKIEYPGFILKAFKKGKEITLKIQQIKNRKKVEDKIKMFKKLRMSLISEFIENQIIYTSNFKAYAIVEFERYSCSLQTFLDRQLIDSQDGELNQTLKLKICKQIIASMGYLHSFNIIHNNISLQSFQIQFNETGITVKLSELWSVGQLKSNQNGLYSKYLIGESIFKAPEIYNQLSKKYSKESDIFAVGCVLALINDYKNFFKLNNQNQDSFIYPIIFKNMIQKQQNDTFCGDMTFQDESKIQKCSEIHEYVKAFVVHKEENRIQFSFFINQDREQFYSNKDELKRYLLLENTLNCFSKNKEKKPQICISEKKKQKIIDCIINSTCELSLDFSGNFIHCTNDGLVNGLKNCQSLTNLTLNLYRNQISASQISELGDCLESYENLTTLTLNLQYNQIYYNFDSLGSSLGNCKSLKNLKLKLWKNDIEDQSVTMLAAGLGNSQTLKNLTLNLYNNKIGNVGVSHLGSELGNCQSLTTLTLNLKRNRINDIGVSELVVGLKKCLNLKNLVINIQNCLVTIYYNRLQLIKELRNWKQLITITFQDTYWLSKDSIKRLQKALRLVKIQIK